MLRYRHQYRFLSQGLIVLGLAQFAFVQTGCRRAAYTELYVEQLNNESRLLEDRIYEYDAAYRSQETELEMLRRDNERLRHELMQGDSSVFRPRSHAQPRANNRSFDELDFESDVELLHPPSSGPVVAPIPVPDIEANRSNKEPASSEELSDPFDDDGPSIQTPSKGIESELVPPKIELGQPPSALHDEASSRRSRTVDESDVIEVVELASATVVDSELDDVLAYGAETEVSESQTDSFEDVELVAVEEPQSIDTQLPNVDGDVEQFRIHSPFAEASADTALSSDREVEGNQLEENANGDVIEIAFHPAFTRGLDTDQTPGEDSVRVVLQPKTSSGATVATEGLMTIVIVDPNASSTQDASLPLQLGRWTLTENELEQRFEPIGSAKGYHLELGPLKRRPANSQVIIFVRIEYEDGRKLVNRFPLQMQVDGIGKPVWTPRIK